MEEAAGESLFTFEPHGDHSAECKWTLPSYLCQFGPTPTRQRPLYSQYFPVASTGLDCRLVLYPRGDSLALPGHMSLYIQLMDPTCSKSPFDRFASYKLTAYHPGCTGKSVARDSWYRFTAKKKIHGWSDFAPVSGFIEGETLIVMADITLLQETSSVSPQDGKFSWKLHNFSLFRDTLKTQRVSSPIFPANTDSDTGIKLSIYQSVGTGADGDHLSISLESKDDSTTKPVSSNDEQCWILFRVTVMNQVSGGSNFSKDSYGRFGADGMSLGWTEFMKLDEFLETGSDKSGYVVNGCVVFNVSYHVIKETSVVVNKGVPRGNCKGDGGGYYGKITWKIGGFSKLKEVLKKRKITGTCIKSKKFQVGGRDCRLIVYPRGQSRPPCYLSLFLEVTDPRAPSPDWTCFVSHRLSVLCNKFDGLMVSKESQNRFSKAAKDWGWREFLSLTSLFDQGAGYLVDDAVSFCAEVMVLKETNELMDIAPRGLVCFTWKVENFLAFKDIMETRKIFSKFFAVGGCELRIGAYESFGTICIYLESDQPPSSSCGDPENNFWVCYRIGILNQKDASRSVWRESSICTKSWNNSVLQFMKVNEMMTPDSGFLVRDSVIFVCEIMDCCPWFEFSDLEVFASEDEKEETLTTELDSSDEESTAINSDMDGPCTDKLPQNILRQPSAFCSANVIAEPGGFSAFLSNLRLALSQPNQIKYISDLWNSSSKHAIVNWFLDTMVDCCEESSTSGDAGSTESGEPRSSETSSSSGLDERCEFDMNFCVEGLGAISLMDTGDEVDFHKINFRNHSMEKFALMLSLLKSLDSSEQEPQDSPTELKRCPRTVVRKISTLLEKAPRHFIHDIISVIPKLVDPIDHTHAAFLVLGQIASPGYELPEKLKMFGVLCQLNNGKDVEEFVLNMAFHFIGDANDKEYLLTSIDLLLSYSSRCNKLHQAIQALRKRLKLLGTDVPQCVLDFLCKTIHNWPEVAKNMLKANDDDQPHHPAKIFDASDPYFNKSGCFSDAYLLVEMLHIPSLFIEVCQLVEKLVVSGSLGIDDFAPALEKRHKHQSTQLKLQQQELSVVLALGKVLSGSTESKMINFLRMLYVKLFNIYDDHKHRLRMLDTLVERALNTTCLVDFSSPGSGLDPTFNMDIDMSVLLMLAQDNVSVLETVMNLMRQVACHVMAERANLSDQMCAVQVDNARIKEERDTETARFQQEKELLEKRASDCEATCSHLRSDLKEEKDRFTSEKKHLLKERMDIERQLEWLKYENNGEITKLTKQKLSLQVRLDETAAQLLQLKGHHKEELKKMTKEKTALKERLKKSEAAKRRLEKEAKQHATEAVKWQDLESEVRRLEQLVSKAEAEKREKQEQVNQSEAKFQDAQQYIQTLETSLQEEMVRHGPLYGAGLETLTPSELDIVAKIHESGLKAICDIKKQRQNRCLLANIPKIAPGLFSTQPQALVRNHSPIVPPKGTGSQGNSHKIGLSGPCDHPPPRNFDYH